MQPELTDRQVTIHIGLPKTATTTIQRHLFHNADYLRVLGLDYCTDLCRLGPFPKAAAHHAIARAHCIPGTIELPAESGHLIRERLASSGHYLLSSEVFSRANARAAKAVVDAWDLPDHRRVVVVTRSELDFIRSHWMQGIKVGKQSDSLWEHYLVRYKPHRRVYSERFKGWLEAGFSLTALRYDELQTSPDVTLTFLRSVLDLKIDRRKWKGIASANVSPTHDAVARYQRLFQPVHRIIAPRVNQRWAAKWYIGAHDIFCKNPLIRHLGECKQYRDDLARVEEDLMTLSAIDDVTYSKSTG